MAGDTQIKVRGIFVKLGEIDSGRNLLPRLVYNPSISKVTYLVRSEANMQKYDKI